MKRTTKAPEVVTHRTLDHGGKSYFIAVMWYDRAEGMVTAEWSGPTETDCGKLGFGVRQCDEAISLAERAIRKQF